MSQGSQESNKKGARKQTNNQTNTTSKQMNYPGQRTSKDFVIQNPRPWTPFIQPGESNTRLPWAWQVRIRIRRFRKNPL